MTPRDGLEAAIALLTPYVGGRFDTALRRRLAHALREAGLARGLREEQVAELAAVEPDLLRELIDRTIVPETSFFRYAAHFDVLVRHVLPAVDGPLRVWCAACSTGQEPYSIAMALAEAGARDYRVVATDVSAAALERVREGSYADRELRGLSPMRRDRFMSREGSRWEIVPELRERVTVTRSNLIEDDPPFARGFCQAVFCRNVTIYFDRAQIARAVGRIADWLPAGGYLFLGGSESLAYVEVPLELVQLGATFAYRRTPRQAPSRPAGKPPRRVRSHGGGSATARPRPLAPVGGREAEPARPAAPPPAPPVAADLLASGDEAARGGDWWAAARLFRQAAYVAPAEPVPHALLGLALERVGQERAARRAFSAARGALEHAGEHAEEATLGLEGFDLAALGGLLDEKLGISRQER